MAIKTLYTAVGRFERRTNGCNRSCPIILLGGQEYMVDMQEMVIWSMLNWRILRWDDIAQEYEKLATASGYCTDYEKTLVGVILHNHATCAYWPAGSEYDDDTTPLCSSVDGKVGIGTPGGACAACVMNRFGSAPDGSKGKACKNMRVLYLLRSGEYMPLQVNLPPTSIKPFKEFLNRAFMLRRRATYGSIVQIGLKRENNGTNDYSVATFKLLQDFQGEELAQIRAYANSFKEQIKLLLQQRAEITEEQRDTGCDYVIEPGAMTNEPADGHYTVSQINGDCEQLPA